MIPKLSISIYKSFLIYTWVLKDFRYSYNITDQNIIQKMLFFGPKTGIFGPSTEKPEFSKSTHMGQKKSPIDP